MKLFEIIFPNEIQEANGLYFRSEPEDLQFESGFVKKGTVLRTDTYYNIFSLSKYQKYTNIQTISLHLKAEGLFRLSIYQQSFDRSNRANMLISEEVHFEKDEQVQIPIECITPCDNSVIYFTLEALEHGCRFLSGFYATQITDARKDPVRIAMVICTYKRESYVYHTLDSLCRNIFDDEQNEAKDKIEVFIVDNGRTIEKKWENYPQIHLIPNKNLGGSGGFTRGMTEVLQQEKEFSHVLLTDDDITLDYHVLLKTIQFLKIEKEAYRDTCLAGSMLYIDRPTIQHEAGAMWEGEFYRPRPSKAKLDLSRVENLLFNEKEEKVDYAGWGYLCIPLSIIKENDLPLPLFVKWDDVEYAIRSKMQCLTLNGIGFWHPSYENNFNSSLEYYAIRNALVINACHNIPNRFFRLHVGKRYFVNVIYGNYGVARCILQAIYDYLQGIDFFKVLDGEDNHRKIGRFFENDSYGESFTRPQKAVKSLRALFRIDFWKSSIRFVKVFFAFCVRHKKIDNEYHDRYREICSLEFWNSLFKEAENEKI